MPSFLIFGKFCHIFMRVELLCLVFCAYCLSHCHFLRQVSAWWRQHFTERYVNKMNSRFLHSILLLLFYNSLIFLLGLLAWLLICQTIFSPKEALSLKYATKCEIQLQRCSTPEHQTQSSQQTDREWLIAFFFLGRNPIHAKQKSYFVSVMVWLYYCAFHEIHLKGGASLAHSHSRSLPAVVLWSRRTLAILPGNNHTDACEAQTGAGAFHSIM